MYKEEIAFLYKTWDKIPRVTGYEVSFTNKDFIESAETSNSFYSFKGCFIYQGEPIKAHVNSYYLIEYVLFLLQIIFIGLQ